jgi:hypothetical protein
MTLKIRAYPSGHCPQATPSTESNASMTTTGQTIPVDRTALTGKGRQSKPQRNALRAYLRAFWEGF